MINLYQESLVTAQYNTASYIPIFLTTFGFIVLPLTENIGHRASIYVEEYTLSSNLRSGDAIMVATAVENNMILSSNNVKHFKVIKELKLIMGGIHFSGLPSFRRQFFCMKPDRWILPVLKGGKITTHELLRFCG